MTDEMAKSAIDGMRTLTLLIDRSIEALMEAHGFVFARMNATGNSADALFTNQEAADLPPWHLTLRHSADDDLTVLLTKSAADRDQISLSILVGTETAKTLAEGVGLAVSFVAFSDQLAASV